MSESFPFEAEIHQALLDRTNRGVEEARNERIRSRSHTKRVDFKTVFAPNKRIGISLDLSLLRVEVVAFLGTFAKAIGLLLFDISICINNERL
ncbi:hypothetical protein AVEN_93518-1 [Araneus ventricosus]|uniref:Uncharacterized protein n=1 Tax=Araneus ventricosus TaxID=182803 RepID=A0A4Y2APS7_ARAVE|nr:hypothetical protein AVEN_93518-1 [Araneus ventricosus]